MAEVIESQVYRCSPDCGSPADQPGHHLRGDRAGKRQRQMQMLRRHQAAIGRHTARQCRETYPQTVIRPQGEKDALQIFVGPHDS